MSKWVDWIAAAAVAMWLGYWVGHHARTDRPWQLWVVVSVCGMFAMWLVVELIASLRELIILRRGHYSDWVRYRSGE